MNPFTQSQKPVSLPKVDVPSLEGLTVEVATPRPITQDELAVRFEELRRIHATVTPREKGQPLGPTDEACVTILAYARGKLVPRSAQFETWLRLDVPTTISELGAALALAKVGDGLKVNVTLPANFHVPELRGVPAVYLVDVRKAHSVTLPNGTSPAFLAKLGVKTIQDAFTTIANDLGAQRKLSVTFEALERVIDLVGSRVDFKVAKNLLEQELWKQWREAEGKELSDHGLVGQEQTDAFESWKSDPLIVADVVRRLRNSLAVGAIIEANSAQFTPERISQTAVRWAPYLGVPDERLTEAVSGDVESRRALGAMWAQLSAAEWLLERATLKYV